MTSKTKRRLLWWGLGLVIGYTLLGFFVAPYVLRSIVLWKLPPQIDRTVTLDKIRLNPFTFSVAIDGLAIREHDGSGFVSWDEVFVDLNPTALFSHELLLSAVSVSNAYAHVQINQDGSFNFSDILKKFPAEPGTPAKPSKDKPLILRIAQLRIINFRVDYRDLSHATPFATTVGPIDLSLHDFSTDPSNNNPYGFDAITESGEKLIWRGSFFLSPIRSRGEFSIAHVKLNKYAPYYNDFINLTIHDGTLDVRASYQVEFTDHLATAQVSNLTVQVHSLKVGERGSATNIVEFPETEVAGTFIDLASQIVNVGTTRTHGARFDLERLTNGTINLVNLVVPQSPPKVRSTASSSVTNTAKPAAWVVSVHEVDLADWAIHASGFFAVQNVSWQELQVANIQVTTVPFSLSISNTILTTPNIQMLIPENLTNLFATTPKSATTNTASAAPAAKTALPALDFGDITVTNGILGYDDKSLQPEAAIALDNLGVSIHGLSSSPDSSADILVNGRVDNIAPIEVTGHINPLNPDAATDMQVTMKGIDLVPVGSYSGRYLGYLLRQGKLSVDLKYKIDQRKLDAQNRITVDQFTFGDKTDSPQAVKLPVKLGVAILKDRNGQIQLNVPIEGRIDDPQFHYMGAVWHVLGGLFTKIFTAPFSMLGSMFGGGGEELSYQEFAPGSAVLPADQTKKLDVLIKALTERPALNVELTGSIDPVKDIEPLRYQKLDQRLLDRRAQQEPGVTNALTVAERTAYLRQVYAEALPRIQQLQPATAATNQNTATNLHSNIANLETGEKPPTKTVELNASQAKKVAAGLTVEEMERQYLPLIELTPDDYRHLAAARVANVVAYFKTKGQIADDRLLVSTSTTVPVLKEGPRVIFSLQ